MATFDILDVSPAGAGYSYISVRVAFADLAFDQVVVVADTHGPLADQLQAYADAYEAAWTAANPDPEGLS